MKLKISRKFDGRSLTELAAVAGICAWLSIALAWVCPNFAVPNTYLLDVLILTVFLCFFLPKLVPSLRVDASFVFLTFLFAPLGTIVRNHSVSATMLLMTLVLAIALAYSWRIKL
jgi:hypothetical protein